MSGIWRQKYCPKCYHHVWRLIYYCDNDEYCPYCNTLMKLVIPNRKPNALNVNKNKGGDKIARYRKPKKQRVPKNLSQAVCVTQSARTQRIRR